METILQEQEPVHYRPDSYISLRKKLREVTQRVNPQDILSIRYHSRDFNTSRAEYISLRIRTLAVIFALLAPLWIPIDYLVMDNPTFGYMVTLRLLFSTALLSLSRWGTHCNLLSAARMRILLFLLVPCVFFLTSHLLLIGIHSEHAILLGYSFLPFLMMALLTIVPLTLLEWLASTSLILAFFVATKLFEGTLLTIPVLGELWLLLLLAIIALWVVITQLHILMRLYREATRDALTGLANRRVLANKLAQEVEFRDEPLSVLLFDLDLFKRINDTYGHHAGDTVLQAFGEILRFHCRGNNLVGRYGGEEFLAILPGMEVREAKALADRIRKACHLYHVHTEENKAINFTTSIGVALHRPQESAYELLSRVDQGLYTAKIRGRDMVSVAD